MRRPRDRARRGFALLARGAAAALLATGCLRPSRHRPTTTTTAAPPATTGPPATTTTTTGAGAEHTGDDHGAPGDDKGWSLLTNGHQHDHGEVPLDAATQQELDRQLAISR